MPCHACHALPRRALPCSAAPPPVLPEEDVEPVACLEQLLVRRSRVNSMHRAAPALDDLGLCFLCGGRCSASASSTRRSDAAARAPQSSSRAGALRASPERDRAGLIAGLPVWEVRWCMSPRSPTRPSDRARAPAHTSRDDRGSAIWTAAVPDRKDGSDRTPVRVRPSSYRCPCSDVVAAPPLTTDLRFGIPWTAREMGQRLCRKEVR